MKRILSTILVLVSLAAGAQSLPGYFTPIASPYDYQWLRARYLRLPLTTQAGRDVGSIYYNQPDSSAYVWTGFNYLRLGGSGGGGTVYSAGYGLILGGSVFRADSTLLATRLWQKKAIDSLAGVFSAGYYSKTAADGRYALLGHTHTAAQVTDFTAAARASFTAGTGINITGGVISFTGGGSGTYTYSAPLSEASGTVSITQANGSTNGYLSAIDWNTFNGKQAALVSGTSIKTINGTSLLGSGDLVISGGTATDTTSLSNRIDQKQNTSDTSTVDATRHWVNAQNFLKTYSESDPTVDALIKSIPVSADAATNKYLNWNGSAYSRKQVDYSELSGTPAIPTNNNQLTNGAGYTTQQALNDTASALRSAISTASGGMTNPMTAQGDMIYGGASGAPTRLSGGVDGYSLRYNGTTNAPYWAPSAGGIDDVLAIGQTFSANRTINTSSYGLTVNSTGATTPLTVSSIGATGLMVSTSTGLPLQLVKNPSTTNTVEEVLTLRRQTSGAVGNGIGARIRFQLERTSSASSDAGSIDAVFDDASTAPHSSIQISTNDTKVGNYSGRQVQTTDATPTTIQTITITDETAGIIEVLMVGRTATTTGKLTGKKLVGYRKDGGVLTLDTPVAVLADVAGGDLSTATWTIAASGNNIIIQATGEAAKTIEWKCVVNVIDR